VSHSQEVTEDIDGLPPGQRLLAAVTISLGLMMSVMDGAIANLALPTLSRELQVSAASSIWVVSSYQLAMTMTLLPLAALGEIIGYARVYRIGVIIFTLSSLTCALSHNLLELTLSRAVQGVGAAGMMGVNAAMVRFIFPRRLLGRGFGMNTMVGSSSSALGPTVAAAILAVANWQWLFAVNVPVGIVVLLMGARTLPKTPLAKHKLDLVSVVLNAVMFGLFILSIDGIGHGGDRVVAAFEMAGAVVAGWALARRCLSQPSPLLPIDLLRRPIFTLSVVAATFSFAAQSMAFVSLPFYFQVTLGLSTTQAGLLMTPWPVVVAIVAPLSGRLSDRFSAGLIGGIGQAIMVVGLLSLALLPAHPALWDISLRMSVCGVGFGLFNSPNNRTLITAAPPARSGAASGMQATSRLTGLTTGTALAALLFSFMPAGGGIAILYMAGAAAGLAGIASAARPGRRAGQAG
jgi:DHA2 family multidrug resistance protein-like MFS transporter